MTRFALFFVFVFASAFTYVHSPKELPLCDAVKTVTKAMKEKKFSLIKGGVSGEDQFESKIDIAGWESESVYDNKSSELSFSAELNTSSAAEARTTFKDLKAAFSKCLGVQPQTMTHDDGETLQYEINDIIMVELDLFAKDGDPATWIDLKIIYSRS